jgi:ArsR family transcriptional regulator
VEKSKNVAGSCCAPVLQGRLGRSQAVELAQAFKAIADPARLRLLSFIASQPSGETCVCYLTKPLGLSQPTVSHHLKVLYAAGLLERERRGTWVYYRIVAQRLAELRNALETSPQDVTHPKPGAAR